MIWQLETGEVSQTIDCDSTMQAFGYYAKSSACMALHYTLNREPCMLYSQKHSS